MSKSPTGRSAHMQPELQDPNHKHKLQGPIVEADFSQLEMRFVEPMCV